MKSHVWSHYIPLNNQVYPIIFTFMDSNNNIFPWSFYIFPIIPICSPYVPHIPIIIFIDSHDLSPFYDDSCPVSSNGMSTTLLHIHHVHRARGNAETTRILGDQVVAGEATWPKKRVGDRWRIQNSKNGKFNFEAFFWEMCVDFPQSTSISGHGIGKVSHP